MTNRPEDITQLAEHIRSGQRRALAKAITLVESTLAPDQDAAQQLLQHIDAKESSVRIGISGVPGAGKSTFIEALGLYLIEKGHKVAVLAVDPSSPSSGGSILGDKTRMQDLAARNEAFIRPSPTAGNLGGVARKTRETMRLCEHAGFDVILVETVGVGQSEYEVASMVDCFLLLMIAGAGDSLQGIKRGILELVDVMVINKADGDNLERAKMARSEYQTALHLLKPKHSGTEVPVLLASALQNTGMDEVWTTVEHFIQHLKTTGAFSRQRQEQKKAWMMQLIDSELRRRFWNHPEVQRLKPELLAQLEGGERTAYSAAMMLLDAAESHATHDFIS